MSLELATRLTEMLLGWALMLQAIEGLSVNGWRRRLYIVQLICAWLLILGILTPIVLPILVCISFNILSEYRGPYNGGSDKMGLLVLVCLTLAVLAPSPFLKELAFGYLAVQVVLSYFISGQVKLVNRDWRSGQALSDVFTFSAYPVSDSLRDLGHRDGAMWKGSWAVIGFELVFPLTLFSLPTLVAALFIGAAFHLANAILFGLNRFFWVWCSAYPALIWFQMRLF